MRKIQKNNEKRQLKRKKKRLKKRHIKDTNAWKRIKVQEQMTPILTGHLLLDFF